MNGKKDTNQVAREAVLLIEQLLFGRYGAVCCLHITSFTAPYGQLR